MFSACQIPYSLPKETKSVLVPSPAVINLSPHFLSHGLWNPQYAYGMVLIHAVIGKAASPSSIANVISSSLLAYKTSWPSSVFPSGQPLDKRVGAASLKPQQQYGHGRVMDVYVYVLRANFSRRAFCRNCGVQSQEVRHYITFCLVPDTPLSELTRSYAREGLGRDLQETGLFSRLASVTKPSQSRVLLLAVSAAALAVASPALARATTAQQEQTAGAGSAFAAR